METSIHINIHMNIIVQSQNTSTHCNPMECTVSHHFPEFAKVHVYGRGHRFMKFLKPLHHDKAVIQEGAYEYQLIVNPHAY